MTLLQRRGKLADLALPEFEIINADGEGWPEIAAGTEPTAVAVEIELPTNGAICLFPSHTGPAKSSKISR